jgi:putative oxidoreductase
MTANCLFTYKDSKKLPVFVKVEPVHFFGMIFPEILCPYLITKKTIIMNQIKSIIQTNGHISGLIFRLTLGIVILPHGCQLLLGWFGGFGFQGTMQYFTQVEGLPWIVGLVVILLQSFGALFILFGFTTRLMALGMIGLFIGMILTSHLEYGFFMNWLGNQAGEGYEFHLLVIGLTLALLVNGSGKYSIDYLLTKKLAS